MKRRVCDVLLSGRKNAKTAERIADELDVLPRYVGIMVQRERLAGSPICASTRHPYGYYIAETPAELERYISSIQHRTNELAQTTESLRRTHNRWTGQQVIAGWYTEGGFDYGEKGEI